MSEQATSILNPNIHNQQVCLAASHLLDSILVTHLKTCDDNDHPFAKALLESHNKVHPKSWKAIEAHSQDWGLETEAFVDPVEATASTNSKMVKWILIQPRILLLLLKARPSIKEPPRITPALTTVIGIWLERTDNHNLDVQLIFVNSNDIGDQ